MSDRFGLKADALREILTLNGELRKLRADSANEGARRRAEYESHVASLNAILDSKDQELAALRHTVVRLTPPLVPRRVAEEMGLREGMATVSGLVAEKEPDQK